MTSKTTTKATRKNSLKKSQKKSHRINRQRRLQKQLQMLVLERHSRKCIISPHPEREAIEEEFLHWRAPLEARRGLQHRRLPHHLPARPRGRHSPETPRKS